MDDFRSFSVLMLDMLSNSERQRFTDCLSLSSPSTGLQVILIDDQASR